MARRISKHLRAARPLSTSYSAAEAKSDGRWITRTIAAGRSDKDYTCPECLRTVSAGSAHVVAWPAQPPLGSTSGVEFRRHWHTGCWKRRR